jgi:hypothetical protein
LEDFGHSEHVLKREKSENKRWNLGSTPSYGKFHFFVLFFELFPKKDLDRIEYRKNMEEMRLIL